MSTPQLRDRFERVARCSPNRRALDRDLIASRIRAAFMLLLVGCTLWIANHGGTLSLRSSDLEPLDPPRFETDLNSAPGYELQLLPGVGPKSVQDIEEFRQRRGLFQSSEELDEVPGFGEVKIKQLKENVVVRPTRGNESSQ